MDTLFRLLIILFLSYFNVQGTGSRPEPEATFRSLTQITDVQAIILESFPAQINLTVTGYQPDGCDFPVQVEQRRDGNTVTLDIYRDVPPDVMCPMILLPYTATLHLDGGFESGTYTIRVNDYELEVTV